MMNPTNEIVEENKHCLFGLKHKGYNNLFNLVNALAQQYKCNTIGHKVTKVRV